jgi:hypothetical protein
VGRRKRHHTVTRALLAGFAQGRTITERVRGGAEFGQSIVNASVEADFYFFSDAGARRSPPGATTRSTDGPAPASTGPSEPRCRPTCSATPPSPPSVDSPATPLPRPSPVTHHHRSPGATCTPASPKSPPPSQSSPAKPIPSLTTGPCAGAAVDDPAPPGHPTNLQTLSTWKPAFGRSARRGLLPCRLTSRVPREVLARLHVGVLRHAPLQRAESLGTGSTTQPTRTVLLRRSHSSTGPSMRSKMSGTGPCWVGPRRSCSDPRSIGLLRCAAAPRGR